MMMKYTKKVFDAALMVLVLVCFAVALQHVNGIETAYADDTGDDGEIVYLTVSDDGEFITGSDAGSTVMARVPVRINYTDLADYGLAEFYRREAEPFEDGGDYIPGSPVIETPTALHVFLKAVATYYYDDPDNRSFVPGAGFTCSGSATHLFITSFFGHGLNFNYFVNHEFPLQCEGTGATADYVFVGEGDEIDVGMFTDMSFHTHGAFAEFTGSEYTISSGEEMDNSLLYSSTSEDGEVYSPMPGETIRVSRDYGRTWTKTDVTTDETGNFTMSFEDAGVYYLSAGPDFNYMSERGISEPCVAPPICVVRVEPGKTDGLTVSMSENSAALSWDTVGGADTYKVEYRKTGSQDWSVVRKNSESAIINGLDWESEYEFKVSAIVTDKYVPYGEAAKELVGDHSDTVKATTPEEPPSEEMIEREQADRVAALAAVAEAETKDGLMGSASGPYTSSRTEYQRAKDAAAIKRTEYEAVMNNHDQAAIRAAEAFRDSASVAKEKSLLMYGYASDYLSAVGEAEGKAESAYELSDKWVASAAAISDGKKAEAETARGKAEELLASYGEHALASENAMAYASPEKTRAESVLAEAEAAVQNAIRAKAEADQKKSDEEKAEDDLNDAKGLYDSYTALQSALSEDDSAASQGISDHEAKISSAESKIRLAEEDAAKDPDKAIDLAGQAKTEIDEAEGSISAAETSLGKVKECIPEIKVAVAHLKEAAHKAVESCGKVSEEKKAEAEAILQNANMAEETVNNIEEKIPGYEEAVAGSEDRIAEARQNADKVLDAAKKAKKEKEDKEEEEKKKKAFDQKVKTAKAQKIYGLKVRALKKRRARVTWKKNAKVSGYQIKRALGRKSGKKIKAGKYKLLKTIKKAGTVRFINKKLKKGKTYFYKMRPFTKIKGLDGKTRTYYGKWTAVKKIKA